MTLTVPSKFTTLVNDTDNDADVVEAIQTDLYNGIALIADYVNDNMPLVSGNNTWTGTNTWSGATVFTNAASFSMQGVASRIVLASDQAVADITTAGLYFSSATNKPGIRFNGTRLQYSNDGTTFLSLGSGVNGVSSKSANYTAVANDLGYLIVGTGTWTLTLTAAATLTAGWFVYLRNDGTGVITIDPNASETIDGVATINVYPGEAFQIICDGSNFKTVGRRMGWIPLKSQTASAVSSVDFTSFINSDFSEYLFEGTNILPATDQTNLMVRFSQDAGSNWKSGGSDYTWGVIVVVPGNMGNNYSSTGDTSIILGSDSAAGQRWTNTAGQGGNFSIRLYNPAGTATKKYLDYRMNFTATSPNVDLGAVGGGAYIADNNAINGVRFLFSSGNITTGTITMYGLRSA